MNNDYLDFAVDVHSGTYPNVRDVLYGFTGGPFSLRQIQAITGLPQRVVRAGVGGCNGKTGGTFSPTTLQDLKHLRDYYLYVHALDTEALDRVLSGGTGFRVASRLTGISESTLRRHRKDAHTDD